MFVTKHVLNLNYVTKLVPYGIFLIKYIAYYMKPTEYNNIFPLYLERYTYDMYGVCTNINLTCMLLLFFLTKISQN